MQDGSCQPVSDAVHGRCFRSHCHMMVERDEMLRHLQR